MNFNSKTGTIKSKEAHISEQEQGISIPKLVRLKVHAHFPYSAARPEFQFQNWYD